MAKCVFEHCDNEGGRYNLRFTDNQTKKRYYSVVPMCRECWQRMHDSKNEHGQAQLDVTFSPTHTSFFDVGFSLDGREANVTELRFTE